VTIGHLRADDAPGAERRFGELKRLVDEYAQPMVSIGRRRDRWRD